MRYRIESDITFWIEYIFSDLVKMYMNGYLSEYANHYPYI